MAKGGLTATELALCLGELRPAIAGGVVEDIACLRDRDDLLVVLSTGGGKRFLHLAPGGARGRVALTARRMGRADFASGPQVDALGAALVGSTLTGVEQAPGERRCEFLFTAGDRTLRIWVELFSARGLWTLVEGERIAELSRPVRTTVRTLLRGDRYAPPPPRPGAAPPDPPPRFLPPVVEAIDRHFTALDQAEEQTRERDLLLRALTRAQGRAQDRIDGLERQLAGSEATADLRAEADLMLAYSHTVKKGAAAMTVPDPRAEGALRTIALDPSKPVPVQARRRYDRARRLTEGAAVAAQRLLAARAELAELSALQGGPEPDLPGLRARLGALGLLPRPQPVAAPTARRPKPKAASPGRRFVSAEGYPILVGRSNEENDRLSLRVARGNDLWLHVGGGRGGSHVVVRLPKGRTASLETMLDAATLAVHFSKARGERSCEVVYTQAKHVRKPKGLPAGRVVPHQVRTLVVRLEEDRLRRLLDSAASDLAP